MIFSAGDDGMSIDDWFTSSTLNNFIDFKPREETNALGAKSESTIEIKDNMVCFAFFDPTINENNKLSGIGLGYSELKVFFKIKNVENMKKFNILKSIPANLPMMNVDTDMIIPKQFLKTIKRSGLGKSLFFEMRYDEQGKKINDFVLNKEPYNKSSILLAGKNFGCGSSREHAPWSLLDFGIKCVISPSFADIFYNNCFKNGMLPIVLDPKQIEELIKYSKKKETIEINLSEQKIKLGNKIINFEIDTFKKKCLLNGLDDIALSLEKSEKISSYEKNIQKTKPWMN